MQPGQASLGSLPGEGLSQGAQVRVSLAARGPRPKAGTLPQASGEKTTRGEVRPGGRNPQGALVAGTLYASSARGWGGVGRGARKLAKGELVHPSTTRERSSGTKLICCFEKFAESISL